VQVVWTLALSDIAEQPRVSWEEIKVFYKRKRLEQQQVLHATRNLSENQHADVSWPKGWIWDILCAGIQLQNTEIERVIDYTNRVDLKNTDERYTVLQLPVV